MAQMTTREKISFLIAALRFSLAIRRRKGGNSVSYACFMVSLSLISREPRLWRQCRGEKPKSHEIKRDAQRLCAADHALTARRTFASSARMLLSRIASTAQALHALVHGTRQRPGGRDRLEWPRLDRGVRSARGQARSLHQASRPGSRAGSHSGLRGHGRRGAMA